MVSREIVWENTETFGCEYLSLLKSEEEIAAESTVIFMAADSPVQVNYQIRLDTSWRTVSVSLQDRQGRHLRLSSNGEGDWLDGQGSPLDELKGAIDVDLSATPFSNSLPINRFDWEDGQSRTFEMVYISLPEMHVRKMAQQYTMVKTEEDLQLFKYQSAGFEALIHVDEQGLVVEYSPLFKRRYANLV